MPVYGGVLFPLCGLFVSSHLRESQNFDTQSKFIFFLTLRDFGTEINSFSDYGFRHTLNQYQTFDILSHFANFRSAPIMPSKQPFVGCVILLRILIRKAHLNVDFSGLGATADAGPRKRSQKMRIFQNLLPQKKFCLLWKWILIIFEVHRFIDFGYLDHFFWPIRNFFCKRGRKLHILGKKALLAK